MDDSSRSSSQSSDPEMPSKRQRIASPTPSSSSTSDSDFVLGIDWETRRMRKELSALRLKLSQTEATAIQHHKLRKQTEELLVKEKNILEMQAQRDKETIEQLEEDLETAMRRAHESRKAQVAAESAFSKMEQQIREFSNKNTRTKTTSTQSTPEEAPGSHEELREALERLKAAEQRIKHLERKLEETSTSQAEFELNSNKLEQAKITIHKLNAANRSWVERDKLLTSRVKELEEELESSKDKLAMLSGVVKEKVSENERLEEQLAGMEEKLKTVEKLRAQVMMLRGRCQEFCFKLHECKKEEGTSGLKSPVDAGVQTDVVPSKAPEDAQKRQQEVQRKTREAKKKSVEMTRKNIEEFDDVQSVVNGAGDRDPSWNAPGDEFFSDSQSDEEDSVSQADGDGELDERTTEDDVEPERTPRKKQADGELRVDVGSHYHVIASSPEFFTVKWQYEYRHKSSRRWACKKCETVELTRNKIEDHVWVSHYDGFFTCPHCAPKTRLMRRDSIREHVKRMHPKLHHVLGAKGRK